MATRGKLLPETTAHAILQEYQEGVLLKQITWKYGVDHKTINRYITKLNISHRRNDRRRGLS